MGKIIAFCGLDCGACPAYIATQNDDHEERKRVAQLWSKEFNADIKPENINCDGCLAQEGRQIEYCRVCKIRLCGLERSVENCGHCNEFPCQELSGFIANIPQAKATLEEINKSR